MKFQNWVPYLLLILGAGVLAWVLQRLPAQDDMTWFYGWVTAAGTYGYSDLASHSSFNYMIGFIPVVWLANTIQTIIPVSTTAEFTVFWRVLTFSLGIILTIWLICALRPLTTHRERIWIAASLLFAPFFLWITLVWGQVDMLVLLPWMIAVVYLARNQYLWAILAGIIAISQKPTGLLLLPLLVVLAVVTKLSTASSLRRYLMPAFWVGFALVLVALPWLGSVIAWLGQKAAWGANTAVTYNAYNFWFFQHGSGPAQTLWHGLSYQIWGGLAWIALVVPLTWWLFRSAQHQMSHKDRLVLFLSYAVVYSFGFVFLLTDMHERYWDFVLVPLTLLAVLAPRWRVLAGLIHSTAFLNLIAIFPSSIIVFQAVKNHWFDLGTRLSWLHALALVIAITLYVINNMNHETKS